MRIGSPSLRLALVGLLIAVVAIACVAALVLAGVLRPNGPQLAGAGAAILLVALLAAAVSALGPKYRPTPLLTPAAAGVFAAMLATTVLYAGHAQVAPKAKPAVATASVAKPKPVTRPVRTAPVISSAAIEPEIKAEPAVQPKVEARLGFVTPAPAPTAAPVAAVVAPPVQSPPPQERSVPEAAIAAVERVMVPGAEASEKAAPSVTAPAKPVAAVTHIPIPAAAPSGHDSGGPIDLQAGFDTSAPTVPRVGPPLALASAASTQPVSAATPPHPRIRPCGGAGPACP